MKEGRYEHQVKGGEGLKGPFILGISSVYRHSRAKGEG